MGIGGLLKSYVTTKKTTSTIPKPIEPKRRSVIGSNLFELQPPNPQFESPSRTSSAGSTQSSTILDDIKHEVMVNYLYQQQCSHLWVGDLGPEMEGVLLRKSRNAYMACPPELGDSPFATACAALNVQVSQLPNVRLLMEQTPIKFSVP